LAGLDGLCRVELAAIRIHQLVPDDVDTGKGAHAALRGAAQGITPAVMIRVEAASQEVLSLNACRKDKAVLIKVLVEEVCSLKNKRSQ